MFRSTPIRKAEADELAWEAALTELADKVAPKLRASFVAAIRALRSKVDVQALTRALQSGHVDQVMRAVGFDPTGADLDAMWARIRDAAEDGAKAASELIEAQTGARAEVYFGASNPAVEAHFDAYRGGLIRQITEDTRQGVMQVIRQTTAAGMNPTVAARQIKGMIGLTERQAQAVQNYRAELESRSKAALVRALRDRRFDRTVARAAERNEGLNADQIDRMVERYAERYLAFRAETIARTEAIRAVQAGADVAIHAAVTDGKLPVDKVRRMWIVAYDERTCAICKQIAALNPDGVALGKPFNAPLGSIQYPPAHPRCRCAVAMRLMVDQPVQKRRSFLLAEAVSAGF